VKARQSAVFLLTLGVLGSQAGHLLAYQLRFGSAAFQLQSSAAHGYFPTVAKTGLGLMGALGLGSVLVVGLARVVSGRALRRVGSGPSYLRLVAALYTIQLALFAGQETAEAALAGVQAGSVTTLLLWGTLGQLPVAALAALALRWLATRFEAAVDEIRTLVGSVAPPPAVVAALAPAVVTTEAGLLPPQVAGSAIRKRGPPSFLRISSV
jgi:hypothetical protein